MSCRRWLNALSLLNLTVALLGSNTQAMRLSPMASPVFLNKEDLQRSCSSHLQEAQKVLESLLGVREQHTEANTLLPYNEIMIHLNAVTAPSSLLSSVHPDEKIREAAEKCEQEAAQFMTNLFLNKELYEAFLQVDTRNLPEDSKRLTQHVLRDFRRAGVDKDDPTREHIKQLQEELVRIGQDFSRNIREDVRFIDLDSAQDLEGLPEDYVSAHSSSENGKIRITTDYPDYIPFMTYAKSEQAREALWRVNLQRGYPSNESVLSLMLQKRYELAQVLGYASYADYIAEDKMIKTADNIADFIDKIAQVAAVAADRDYGVLLSKKRETYSEAREVLGFERGYLEEQIKQAQFNFDSQEVRPYFEFNRVKAGLLKVTGDLFGIRYVPVNDAPVWHSSVAVYDVLEGDKKLGRIYLDLYPREGKYKHAAQFDLRGGAEGIQLPEGVLVCNFPDPTKMHPALMDHDQVVTFFHEFGHLLHHILGGHQRYINFSGVATEWDFVEAPSQLMEEWAWDPHVLRLFAVHYQTGEAIPAELVQKMRAADEFGKGLDVRQQMFYAATSFQYHKLNPSTFNLDGLLRSLQTQYSKFPYVEGTHFNLSFGHLEGYSAGYYTYMWSKVIAKDMLTAFSSKGLMDPIEARRYRDRVLAQGGAKDADVLVADFLGRPYQFDAFKNWLLGI